MVNCAHPTHFGSVLAAGGGWRARNRGLRAKASRMSHAELDEADELDAGDPADLAARYLALRECLPALTILGGCCRTDARHIAAIRLRLTRPASRRALTPRRLRVDGAHDDAPA